MRDKRRRNNRLLNYDYSQNGWYFTTICTAGRKNYFGAIVDDKMVLNEYGKIVEKYWREIADHYDQIKLDEFVIMPNHIHGIIIIQNNQQGLNYVGTEQCSVPTRNNRFGLISKVIKSYKEAVIKFIRHNYHDNDFAWQRSFYDHVIRNEKSLDNIRHYIRYNPLQWAVDRENIVNYIND